MRLKPLLPAVLCLLSAGIASANTFSYTGVLSQDDQLQIFMFAAPSTSVTVRTWSYAGGTNAAGTVIDPGGFDPILSVFDATSGLLPSSILIATNNDGGPGVVNDDPFTGNAWDAFLTLSFLTPGNIYAVVLSENDNGPGPDFGSSFPQTGQGNFTSSFGCGATAFCDLTPSQRTGQWAVDILGVGESTGIPEPSPALLIGAGTIGLALLRRRARQVH